MSKKRRRKFGNPPNRQQSMDIAVRILGFAEQVAAGEVTAAVDDMARWFKPTSSYDAELRVWYLASAAPLIAMAMVRKYFPVDMEPDDLWILEQIPDSPIEHDPHAKAMAQVLVRYLNDDTVMARALTAAHFEVFGYDGLFELGLQAVKFTAGVIRYGRERDGCDMDGAS